MIGGSGCGSGPGPGCGCVLGCWCGGWAWVWAWAWAWVWVAWTGGPWGALGVTPAPPRIFYKKIGARFSIKKWVLIEILVCERSKKCQKPLFFTMFFCISRPDRNFYQKLFFNRKFSIKKSKKCQKHCFLQCFGTFSNFYQKLFFNRKS